MGLKNGLMKKITCIAVLTAVTMQSFAITGNDSAISIAAASDKKNAKYYIVKEDKSYLKSKTFTLSAAGDVTLSSDIKQPASVNFFSVYNKQKPEYFFKGVKKVFAKDDLTLVNCEGTLSNRGSRANKQWAFRGKPSYVNILKKGSIEAVSFANNHTRDYGEISYKDTMSILKKAKIAYATESKVTIKKVNGIKVGLVAITSVGATCEPVSRLKKLMKDVKKKKAEVIIVSMHSGIEGTQTLSAIQTKLSHTAIDMGADLVIGHHPHVMQRISRYKGSYILYSMGNFCFGGNTNPKDKDTFIFQQTFVVKNGKLVKKKNAKVIPCRLSGKDYVNNYQPVICKGSQKKRIISRLNSYSSSVRIDGKGMIKDVKK